MTVAGTIYFSLVGSGPSGELCSFGDGSGNVVDAEECTQTGTLTQCVRPDGKHCATASTGAQFCWSPGEAGQKQAANGNEAGIKSPDGANINAPASGPKNGGDWSVNGQSNMSSSSGGGSTTNYNITTVVSSYGTQGTGSGDGTGTGTGDGGGEGEGDDDGAGSPGNGVGELYEGTDLTAEGLASRWFDQVSSTPILQGMTSFMSVSGGGSCPVISLSASQWWEAMTYTAHCSGEFLAFLRAAGWLIFAIACYFAIRIAVT